MAVPTDPGALQSLFGSLGGGLANQSGLAQSGLGSGLRNLGMQPTQTDFLRAASQAQVRAKQRLEEQREIEADFRRMPKDITANESLAIVRYLKDKYPEHGFVSLRDRSVEKDAEILTICSRTADIKRSWLCTREMAIQHAPSEKRYTDMALVSNNCYYWNDSTETSGTLTYDRKKKPKPATPIQKLKSEMAEWIPSIEKCRKLVLG